MAWQHELGRQIREARKFRGLSQRQLANHLSVTREQLSNYENGKSAPPINVVAEIAAALDWEFEVGGCKISKDQLKPSSVPPSQPQLCFAYDTEHRFSDAALTIKPSRKSIVINLVARTS
jgi:transcriptional regulator with XRE-family HTH domain